MALLRFQHRLGDPGIGAAAAEIAAHALADALGIVAGLPLLDQADRAHDLAGRAEAALQAVMGDEGGLHRMQLIAARDALDGEDVGAVVADRQRQARIDAPAVDQHRAGAALAAVASLLGAGQVEALAQQVEQRDARVVQLDVAPHTIDGEADGRSSCVAPIDASIADAGSVDAQRPTRRGVGGIYGGCLRFSRAAQQVSMIWKTTTFTEKIMFKQRMSLRSGSTSSNRD